MSHPPNGVSVTSETSAIYSSRIIKASALIPDTKILLGAWDLGRTVGENLERARHENIFGKASRSRIEDILVIFRQRYFDDPAVGAMLVTLVQRGAPPGWIDPLLYFYSLQNDRTLHDLVVDLLYTRQAAGFNDVPIDVIVRRLRTWVAEGMTTSAWNDVTTARVARGALATLRDFGILHGKATKYLSPLYLPTPVFALVALWLQQRVRSGERVLHSSEWRLFFLPIAGVERFFIEANQEHLLGYQAAGSIIRIDFPKDTLTEYAHVLLEGAGRTA